MLTFVIFISFQNPQSISRLSSSTRSLSERGASALIKRPVAQWEWNLSIWHQFEDFDVELTSIRCPFHYHFSLGTLSCLSPLLILPSWTAFSTVNPTVLAVDLPFWLTNLLLTVSARLSIVFFYFILFVYNIYYCWFQRSPIRHIVCASRISFWLDISIVVYATRVS